MKQLKKQITIRENKSENLRTGLLSILVSMVHEGLYITS